MHLKFWFLFIFLVYTEAIENVTSPNVNTSVVAEPAPEYKFFLNPNDLYATIMEHLGDHPNAKLLAIQMVDASSKIPSGLLDGAFIDQGNYHECYNLHDGNIYGKYCLGIRLGDAVVDDYADDMHTNISELLQPYYELRSRFQLSLGAPVPYRIGVCIPHNMNTFQVPNDFFFLQDACSSRGTAAPFSTAALWTSIFVGIFFIFGFASTVYDIFLHYTKSESLHWSLLMFSYLSNGRKLFNFAASSGEDDQISCLRGVRSLSMMWVIWGHHYATYILVTNDFYTIYRQQKGLWAQQMYNAQLSVESFLVIGGLLTTYIFLICKHKGIKFNLIMFYLNRYLRLTPLYIVMILLHRNLLHYAGHGPYWFLVDKALVDPCYTGWWSNILYLGNYLHKELCVGHSYYLHIDMQLYFLAPLVLYPLYRWPKYGLGGLSLLLVSAITVAYCTAYDMALSNFSVSRKYLEDYLIKTHTRYSSYVIGMIAGYLIYKGQISTKKPSLSKLTVTLLWIASLSIMAIAIFDGFTFVNDFHRSRVVDALYMALNRPFWSLGLSLMLYLCTFGYGGMLNTFFSSKIFSVMARISYSIYLIHMCFIMAFVSSETTLADMKWSRLYYTYFGNFAYSFAAAVITSMTFEAPFFHIQKHLFGAKKPCKPKEEEKTSTAQDP